MSDSLQPHGLYSPWNSPDQNTGVGSLSFLQGIFPTQRLNSGLPHCTWILYQLIHQASPRILECVAYPFSRGSSRPRNQTAVSCIAGRFFTNWAIRETLSYQNVQHLVYFCCNDVLKVITQERCMYMKYTLNVLASQLQRMGEATVSLQWFWKFHFLETLLEYNCFPMWRWFPLSNFVNQLRVYTYPLPLEPCLPPMPSSTEWVYSIPSVKEKCGAISDVRVVQWLDVISQIKVIGSRKAGLLSSIVILSLLGVPSASGCPPQRYLTHPQTFYPHYHTHVNAC